MLEVVTMRRAVALVLAVGVYVLSGCNRVPPAHCMIGSFLLSTDPSFELVLHSDDTFLMRRGQAFVEGHFEYEPAAGDGTIPNSGSIAFRWNGRNETGFRGMERESDRNDVRIFLRSIADHNEATWPVYLGSDNKSHIIVNLDLDHSDLRFDGPNCADET